MYDSSPSSITTDANCHKLFFFAALIIAIRALSFGFYPHCFSLRALNFFTFLKPMPRLSLHFWKCSCILHHSPLLKARKPCFIILCVQSVSLQHFTCSKYSLAGDSSCHWPCIPACLSSSASSRNLFTLALSWQKYSHIYLTYCSFPIRFHNIPRCAFFSVNSYHCHFVKWFVPLASRALL